MDVVVGLLEKESYEEALTALRDFNEKNKSNFQLKESNIQRKNFCKLALVRLSASDQDTSSGSVLTKNKIHSSLLTALRLLARENVGLDELTSEEGLKVVLGKAELCPSSSPVVIADRQDSELEIIIESLKCLCNLVLNNRRLAGLCCDLGALGGLTARLGQRNREGIGQELNVFDMKLLFLLTSIYPDARALVRDTHGGMFILASCLEKVTLDHMVQGTSEDSSRVLVLSSQPARRDLEILTDMFKILFAITMVWHDKEDAFSQGERSVCLRLAHSFRILIASISCGQDQLKDNTLQCLYDAAMNLPTFCAECFIISHVPERGAEKPPSNVFDGFDMSVIHSAVGFMDHRLKNDEVKQSMSVIGTLRNLSKGHRSIRRYLRQLVLPPLGRVTERPDVGNTIKNRLIRNMTASLFGAEDLISEFLFILCKEKSSRFIKYVGYGHAAGLLMSRGLLGGGDPPNSLNYSEDSDSDTEEYKDCKESIDPITGGPRRSGPTSYELLSPQEKEEEMMKVGDALDKLNKGGIFKMVGLDRAGHAKIIEQPEEKSSSSGED